MHSGVFLTAFWDIYQNSGTLGQTKTPRIPFLLSHSLAIQHHFQIAVRVSFILPAECHNSRVMNINRVLQMYWLSHSQMALEELGESHQHSCHYAAQILLAQEEEEEEEYHGDSTEQFLLEGILLEWLQSAKQHFWAWPTSTEWWGRIVLQNWDDQKW